MAIFDSPFKWRCPFSVFQEHSAQTSTHPCPQHSVWNLSAHTSAPSEDGQDKDHVLHAPGVLSTWLVARAQKVFPEEHRISKRQTDYESVCSLCLHKIHFTNAKFSNGIKDLQVKEKVSLLSLGVHYLAYVILKGISLKYHFYFSGWKDTFATVLLGFLFWLWIQRHERGLTQLPPNTAQAWEETIT